MRRMREILGLLLAAGILLLSGCGGGGGGGASGKPTVVATIFAYYDILRAVGGDKVEAVILLPPKTTPHSYEPTVQAKTQVSRARLIVKNGLNLDNWIDKLAVDSKARMLEISKDVPVLQTTETELGGGHEHGEEGHGHGPGNPHIWLDPRVQMAAAEKVRDALIAIDPANKDAFTANAEKYLSELKQLDADFAAAAKEFKTREFIGFHTAYDYLAHRYGLVQVAALEEYPEQGVTPAQARKIIELIKAKGIKVIFNENALPSKDADLIVRETGVKVSVLQPLETYDSPADTYVSLMRQNLKNLKEALAP